MPSDTRHKQERQTADQSTDQPPAGDQTTQPRRDTPRPSLSPFSIMRQGLDETERLFDAALRGEWNQFKRGWASPGSRGAFSMGQQFGDWSPAVEAFQRGSEFVIRADVPGMNRQVLQVEIGDDMVTVRGERREDRKEEREGLFWSERSYGSFT